MIDARPDAPQLRHVENRLAVTLSGTVVSIGKPRVPAVLAVTTDFRKVDAAGPIIAQRDDDVRPIKERHAAFDKPDVADDDAVFRVDVDAPALQVVAGRLGRQTRGEAAVVNHDMAGLNIHFSPKEMNGIVDAFDGVAHLGRVEGARARREVVGERHAGHPVRAFGHHDVALKVDEILIDDVAEALRSDLGLSLNQADPAHCDPVVPCVGEDSVGGDPSPLGREGAR